MKTKPSFDDGLEWLRQLRRKVAKDCRFDLEKQAEVYRAAAARSPYKAYQGEVPMTINRRRLKLAA